MGLDRNQPSTPWSVIDTRQYSDLISTTGTHAEHVSVTGYHHTDVEMCIGDTIGPAYEHIWVPCLAFDAILAVLAVWAGIQHSRQYPRSPKFGKPRLVDILIQGNVIYFLRRAFSYSD